MNRETILRKIKACLRLAASSNPHEAATALRQAQAMMAAHSVTEAEALDVDRATVGLRERGGTPARYIVTLAAMVADCFGAPGIISTELTPRLCIRTVVHFYGVGGVGEVAAYAFTVLRRQLDGDCRKRLVRVRKRANREARREEFAMGWLYAVHSLLPAPADDDATKSAIDRAVAIHHSNLRRSDGRAPPKNGKVREDDIAAGYSAGKKARLHTGVQGASTLALTDGR